MAMAAEWVEVGREGQLTPATFAEEAQQPTVPMAEPVEAEAAAPVEPAAPPAEASAAAPSASSASSSSSAAPAPAAGSSTDVSMYFTSEFPIAPLTAGADLTAALTMKAPETITDRAPIDLSLVIDRSGSMRGPKLELVKAACSFVMSQLREGDRVGIVSYDTNVREDVPLAFLTQENKDKALAKLLDMKSGSSTNLSGGLLRGMSQLAQAGSSSSSSSSAPASSLRQFISSVAARLQPLAGAEAKLEAARKGAATVVKSVFLFTDGLANHGIVKTDLLAAACREANATAACRVSTFGFGADHDPVMLKAVSEAGGGEYLYLESEEKIAESFAEALGGLLSVVAQNVSLRIIANTGVTLKRVRTKLPTTTNADTSVDVEFGDLYSEERRDLLLEFSLPPAEIGTTLVATALAQYFNVCTGAFETKKLELTIERSPEGVGEPDVEVQRQRMRLDALEEMEKAREEAAKGHYAEARAGMAGMRMKMMAMGSMRGGALDCMMADMEEAEEGMQDAATYKMKGAKQLMWHAESHGKQRSCGQEKSAYSNTMQTMSKMMSKAKKG